MRIPLLVSVIFICSITTTSAQNLILNPGFEEHGPAFADSTSMDYEFSRYGVKNWSVPNESYPRFLDSTSEFYGSRNQFDPIGPHSGNAFVGLCVYFMDNRRDYLQGEFSQPLVAGKKYKFTMHLALGLYSTYTIDQFGVYFGKNKIFQPVKSEITSVTPQLILNVKDVFPKKSVWIEISGFYIAQGGEQFFIVGNFRKSPVTVKPRAPSGYYSDNSLHTWYEIDDLFMAISTDKEPSSVIASGKTLVKDNIHFRTGDSTLLADSYPALNEIISEMKKQPNLKVEIAGHTDNIGTPGNNQKLSEARARAVANYLIKNGIAAGRIKTKGYGSSKPISKDQNKNRRVEFIFK